MQRQLHEFAQLRLGHPVDRRLRYRVRASARGVERAAMIGGCGCGSLCPCTMIIVMTIGRPPNKTSTA